MKSRLVICRSNPIAPDPRVEKEARTLSQAGHDVTVIGWDRTGKLPQKDKIQGISCIRLPIKAEYAAGMLNLPQLLRWQWGLLIWLVRHRHEYDLIHACDFDTIIPALVCRTIWHKKVVYDIFDFYADHLRATPEWIKKAIRAIDLRCVSIADAVILADDSRWEQIQGSQPRRSAVIYNSPEDHPFSPQDGKSTDQTFSQRPDNSLLHIVYIGLLQVERGLFELLIVLRRHPQWSLALAGFGGDEVHVLEQLQDMPNTSWHGRISYQESLQLSSAADTLIATYDPTIPNHRYSSPNKVFEAMMLGKPIIVAQDTNMDRIINQAKCGLVVKYGDESDLESALLRLETEPELCQRLGANGRKSYESTYSWKIMQDRLLKLYAELGY
jgi:glycosyltransferase involved in cell wall biosynthesis